jgi:hypothetical protein
MITLHVIAAVILASFSLGVGLVAWNKCRAGCFYQDTHWLVWLGIFVWGDALILAPFWVVSSFFFIFMPPLFILRYLLVFWAIRSAYEVVYWINHQVAQKNYCPPLFRKVSWIGANEAAILYQLLQTCQVVIALSALMMTF